MMTLSISLKIIHLPKVRGIKMQSFKLFTARHVRQPPGNKPATRGGFGPVDLDQGTRLSIQQTSSLIAKKKRETRNKEEENFQQKNSERMANKIDAPKPNLLSLARDYVNSLTDDDIHTIVKRVNNHEISLSNIMREKGLRGVHNPLLLDRIRKHPDYVNWSTYVPKKIQP